MSNQPNLINLALMISVITLCLSVVFYINAGKQSQVMAQTISNNYITAASGDVVFTSKGTVLNDIFLLPLPVKSMEDVAQWSARICADLFTVDFFSYEEHFGRMRSFFTENGWESIQGAIYNSGWLAGLIDKKLTSSAVILASPIVLVHGPVNGFYNWTFQFPLLLSYESASERGVTERRDIIVNVRRIASSPSSDQVGIAIESIQSLSGA
ncbi:DotI/IcmL family type IV secretion protein [Gammaproteobacteria bacterium]|nr:DotI/IcmL family type IV secretion protein [Gammaproteobacteria bacterium]